MLNRRNFLRVAGTAAAATALGVKTYALSVKELDAAVAGPFSPNDQIQLALIGAGIQGQYDTKTAVQVPGLLSVRFDVAAVECPESTLKSGEFTAIFAGLILKLAEWVQTKEKPI